MKKTKLILLILLSQFNSFLVAQSIELNDQTFQFVDFKMVESISDDQWLLIGTRESSEDHRFFFATIDSLVLIDSHHEFSDVINLKKVEIRGTIGYVLIKVFTETHLIRFQINPNSEIIFDFFNKHIFDDNEEILEIKILPNTNIIAVGRKTVGSEKRAFIKILTNYLGSIEYENYSAPGYFNDIFLYPDSSFLLTGSFGTNTIL